MEKDNSFQIIENENNPLLYTIEQRDLLLKRTSLLYSSHTWRLSSMRFLGDPEFSKMRDEQRRYEHDLDKFIVDDGKNGYYSALLELEDAEHENKEYLRILESLKRRKFTSFSERLDRSTRFKLQAERQRLFNEPITYNPETEP